MFDTFQKLLSDFFIFRRFSVDAVAIIFVLILIETVMISHIYLPAFEFCII